MQRGKLVSCTGYATAGKDEFIDALVESDGFVKMAWSDKLCELALAIDPLLPVTMSQRLARFWFKKNQRLSKIVNRLGWVKAKRVPSVREFLQRLGTEGVRNVLGEDTWVNALVPEIRSLLEAGQNVGVTNTRFMNEAVAIQQLGGKLVHITRPGVGAVNKHASDSGEVFHMADSLIENNGTKKKLKNKASQWLLDFHNI